MVMSKEESFLRRWEGHIEELIRISAKKPQAIEAKHQKIVEGACKVFFEKGFHPASMREIAEAAGMSMGQMYHYISSKDDVLFLIHKHMQTSWYLRLMDAKIEETKDPTEKMKLALHASITFLFENSELIQFIYSESKYLSKKHLEVVLEMDDKNVVEYWRDILRGALTQQGKETDVDVAANLIAFMLVFGALRGWNLKSEPAKEVAAFMVDFIFKGLGLLLVWPE